MVMETATREEARNLCLLGIELKFLCLQSSSYKTGEMC